MKEIKGIQTSKNEDPRHVIYAVAELSNTGKFLWLQMTHRTFKMPLHYRHRIKK